MAILGNVILTAAKYIVLLYYKCLEQDIAAWFMTCEKQNSILGVGAFLSSPVNNGTE